MAIIAPLRQINLVKKSSVMKRPKQRNGMDIAAAVSAYVSTCGHTSPGTNTNALATAHATTRVNHLCWLVRQRNHFTSVRMFIVVILAGSIGAVKQGCIVGCR